MKDWVRPYLLKALTKSINRISKQRNWHSEEEKKEWIELKSTEFEEMINNEREVFFRLSGSLQCDFGIGLGENLIFAEIFGSVLAELPEEVFKKLCGMKALFFIFTPFPGAEVKIINLEKGIRKGETLRIVNFPYASIFNPPLVTRGGIVHELAHVFLEHDYVENPDPDKWEDEADELPKKWGFEKEIKAMRDYYAELEKERIMEI